MNDVLHLLGSGEPALLIASLVSLAIGVASGALAARLRSGLRG